MTADPKTRMTDPLPTVRLKILRRSSHPWVFQKMVEKPATRIAPGAVETGMFRAIMPESAFPCSRTLAPETVAQVIADCVLGRRDSENGRTIFLKNPD